MRSVAKGIINEAICERQAKIRRALMNILATKEDFD